MSVTTKQILEILDSRQLSTLVGEFESQHLECKREPYRTETDKQKLELAKDVAALANADGGVILIGYATTTDPAHGEDRIENIRPLPSNLVDKKKYQQILANWLWPPLSSLQVKWYPSADKPDKGVVAIVVPAAEGSNKPTLVVRTVFDESKRIETLFGYFERRQAEVDHYSVQRLQGLLRDGHLLEVEIRTGLQSLQATLEELRELRPSQIHSGLDREEISARLTASLEQVSFHEIPAFTLAAIPERSLDLRELFESRDSELVRLLESPSELRESGFDLSTCGDSRIVEGKLRRGHIENFRLLEMHRDGMIIFAAPGHRLCHGRANRQTDVRLINQLVLIETTYLFCRFVFEALGSRIGDHPRVNLDLRILCMSSGGRPCVLEEGSLIDHSFREPRKAPSASKIVSTSVDLSKVSPARAALLLLEDVYAWFGFETDRVPYTKVVDDVRVVDEETIANES